ncbi:MAG: hypothetical protein IKU43_08880 [Clostridia bacterium]|nr:hypothetical protein [Clostridia bacterium]
MNAIIYFTDKEVKTVELTESKSGNKTVLTLPLSAFGGKQVETVDFAKELFTAKVGDEGYAVVPSGNTGTLLCEFNEKAEGEHTSTGAVMSCFGFRHCGKATLAICKGCENDLKTKLVLKDSIYSLYAHYVFDSFVPYEDITVEYIDLGDADYSDMAREYRRYQIEERGCVPIKDRAKVQPELSKNVDSIEIRVRLAWKPAPSPYAHQTILNEPDMHVALTFDEVYELCKKLKDNGVEKAEICLVGWNMKGHDGRWPQCFPVEKQLGGEEKLRELIKNVKELGYSIVGHTNHRDMYQIASNWSDDDVSVKRDGTLNDHPIFWSGGQPFVACPDASVRYAEDILPKTADLGFTGLHYIDVLTVLPLHMCHSKVHPASTGDTAKAYGKIQEMSKDLFGGFGSEGPYDFAAKDLDYVLYTSFNLMDNKPALCDEIIPFWQLVYHGIILYNPGTETVNYAIKNEQNKLKFLEFGGRPIAYVYSKFLCNHDYEVDWMGSEDFTLRNEKDTERTVSGIAKMYSDYSTLSALQYEFMEKHTRISDGVYETTYSNGTVVTVDYNNLSYTIK